MERPDCQLCGSGPQEHALVEANVKESGHDFVECRRCRLRFYSPRLEFEQIQAFGYGRNLDAKAEAEFFYNNLAFVEVKDRAQQEKDISSYYGRFIDEAFKINPSIESVFEVGGCIGFFLHTIQKRGISITDLAGCELNEHSVCIARDKYGLVGMSAGAFKDYVPQRTYDMVVMLDFIEHTYTPVDDLKKAFSMLNSGGVLLLKTFLEELDVTKAMVAPPWHAYHFFRTVLRDTLTRTGFSIVSWREELDQAIVLAVKKTVEL